MATACVAGTHPYPWPWSGRLAASATALVVVTSATPSGDVTATGLTDAVTVAVDSLRQLGVLIAEVRTVPPPARRPPPVGERAPVRWDPDLLVEPSGWDGFHGTALDGLLRAAGRDALVLCGWWLEIAVHSTMRSANDRGYECLLATDLTAGLDPATTAGAISSIHMSGGIFGATGLGSELLAALTDSHHNA